MTFREISLVKTSFKLIAPTSAQATALFYARLFELDPTLRPLFRGDMVVQGQKLMQALALVTNSLDQLDTILPEVKQLGIRHARYGVREAHYSKIGEALLWTLEKNLGPAFTPKVRAAWTNVYLMLASAMMAAAQDATMAKPRSQPPEIAARA